MRIWRAPGRPPLGAHEVELLGLLQPYLLNAMLGFGELAAADDGDDIDATAAERCRWPCFAHAPRLGVRRPEGLED